MKRNVLSLLHFLCSIITFAIIISACNHRAVDENGVNEAVMLKKNFSFVSNAENNLYYTSRALAFDFEFDCDYPSMSQMTICGDQLAVLVSGLDEANRLYVWVYFFNDKGEETGHFNLDGVLKPEMFSVSRFIGCANGDLAVCSENNDFSEVYFLDQQGGQTQNPLVIDYEDEKISFITGMQALSNGDFVVLGSGLEGSKLIVFNSESEMRFNLFLKERVEKILESGTQRYISYSTQNEKGEIVEWLEEIDWETGVLKQKINISDLEQSGDKFSINGNIYSTNQTDIKKIDLENKEIKTILSWGDTDVDRSVYTNISPICVLSEETLFILGMNNNEFMNNSVLMINQQTGDPFEGVTILTLGGFDIANWDHLQQAVSQFNQSNESFRIQILDYYAGTDTGQERDKVQIEQQKARQQMLLDVLSGNGPDLFYVWGGSTSLAQFERNHLLVDLNPLITADSSFDMDNLIPNVVSACERDGKLFKLASHFFIEGMYGKPEVIQDRQQWTIDEFNQAALTLPDGVRMLTNRTPEELLEANLGGSLQYFIDEITNEARFNSTEFYQVLEWAKTYGQEIQMTPDGRVYEDESDLWDRDLIKLASNIRIDSFWYGYPLEIIEGRADIIGYPSPGQYKAYIVPEELIAISSWSKNPEGCWEFIKYLLSYDYQFDYSSHNYFWGRAGLGYPINQQALDEWCYLELNPDLQPEDPNALMENEPIDGTEVPQEDPAQIKEETQKRLDVCLNLIYSADALYYPDPEIMNIIMEEAAYYFAGEKPVEDVAVIIQDRVQTLLNE